MLELIHHMTLKFILKLHFWCENIKLLTYICDVVLSIIHKVIKICNLLMVHRGYYISAPVLLNLLN